MKMPQRHSKSLRDFIGAESSGCSLWAADASVALGDLARGTALGGALAALEGRSVLLATSDQLTTALALIELDGVARRFILCPPDLPAEQLSQVIATAQADAVVSSAHGPLSSAGGLPLQVICSPTIIPAETAPVGQRETEWIMLTSGTTGAPKRSEEHTSELQSPDHLVCRLLLEKKKKN